MADYLVSKGVPFRDAYKITGNIILFCIDKSKSLETLSLEEYKKINEKFDEEIYKVIDLKNCIDNRKVIGGPSPVIVKKRIDEVKEYIMKESKNNGWAIKNKNPRNNKAVKR